MIKFIGISNLITIINCIEKIFSTGIPIKSSENNFNTT